MQRARFAVPVGTSYAAVARHVAAFVTDVAEENVVEAVGHAL